MHFGVWSTSLQVPHLKLTPNTNKNGFSLFFNANLATSQAEFSHTDQRIPVEYLSILAGISRTVVKWF